MKTRAKPGRAEGWRLLAGAGLIVLAAVLVYGRTLSFGFVNWDDDVYILGNPLVRQFTLARVGELLASIHVANYHPLTMLSYIVDWQVGGGKASVFHFTNVALHAANGVLLAWLVWRLARRRVAALVAGMLFVVHPLQVESVAWIAERKNVLSAFFFLATLIAYAHRRDPGRGFRSLAAPLVLFVAALLSKATAVTLPVTLLLVDFSNNRRLDRAAWLEKTPFFALSLAAGVLALWAQKTGEALLTTQPLWWLDSFFVACRGVLFYIVKAVAPLGLSPIYPYPAQRGFDLPADFLAAPALVVALAAAVFWAGRRLGDPARRLVLLGAGFYIVNLLPVAQIIPVGRAVAADRYFYLPGAGLFLLAGFGIAVLVERAAARPRLRAALGFAVAAAIIVLGALAHRQTSTWRDGMRLWNAVLSKHPGSIQALTNRAHLFSDRGEPERALADLERAVAENPREASAYYNRGSALIDRGDLDRGLADMNRTIELDPNLTGAYNNRGSIFLKRRDFDRALADFEQVIRRWPNDGVGYNNRALVYYHMKRYDNARADVERARGLGFPVNPRFVEALAAAGAPDGGESGTTP